MSAQSPMRRNTAGTEPAVRIFDLWSPDLLVLAFMLYDDGAAEWAIRQFTESDFPADTRPLFTELRTHAQRGDSGDPAGMFRSLRASGSPLLALAERAASVPSVVLDAVATPDLLVTALLRSDDPADAAEPVLVPRQVLEYQRIWWRELRAGAHGQRHDRPSTWRYDDPLYRAACWQARAEDTYRLMEEMVRSGVPPRATGKIYADECERAHAAYLEGRRERAA